MNDVLIMVGFLIIGLIMGQRFRSWSKTLFKIPSSTISSVPRIIVLGQSPLSANVVDGLRDYGYQVLSLPGMNSSLYNISAIAVVALSDEDITNLLICRMLRQQDPSIQCYAVCNDIGNTSMYRRRHITSFSIINDRAIDIINVFPKLETRPHL